MALPLSDAVLFFGLLFRVSAYRLSDGVLPVSRLGSLLVVRLQASVGFDLDGIGSVAW